MKKESVFIELSGFYISELSPDILEVTCKDIVITREHYIELFDINFIKNREKRICLLVETRKVKMLTRDAAVYINEIIPKCSLGIAAVIESAPAQIITDFFIQVMKPVFPVQTFRNKEAAMQWLIQLKDAKHYTSAD